MPMYERWKYCQYILPDGTLCGKTATHECNCGGNHPNDPDLKGWATPPTPDEMVTHPRFVCDEHEDEDCTVDPYFVVKEKPEPQPTTGTPVLTEIDLSKGDGHRHPDIEVGVTYLAEIQWKSDKKPSYILGKFSEQWYGLNFNEWGTSGLQFNTPGTNCSSWKRLWKFEVNTDDKKT